VRDPNHPYLTEVGDHILATFQGRDPNQDQGWSDQRIYVRQLAPRLVPEPIALPHGVGSGSYPVASALNTDEVMVAWTDSSAADDQILSVRGYLKTGSMNQIGPKEPVAVADGKAMRHALSADAPEVSHNLVALRSRLALAGVTNKVFPGLVPTQEALH
jgi:hypothetical protein